MKLGNWLLRSSVIGLAWLLTTAPLLMAQKKTAGDSLLLVVMDPLAKELACVCVKGFGQRDYRKLAARLESTLNQRVSIEFSDDLAETLETVRGGRETIVIGDRSLVIHGAQKAAFKCQPVCDLTDPDGNTTLAAVFVARTGDSAKDLKDIAGRQLFLGFDEADAKYTASLGALRAAGIEPGPAEKRLPYTDAALDMLDSDLSPRPIAVLPSYGPTLLQGCGSVTPGSLKVIGRSEPVPFVTAFLSEDMPADKKRKVVDALLAINSDPQLLQAMESKSGFKRLDPAKPAEPKPSAAFDWPDWRGPNRDGRVPHLPARLPATPKVIWKKAAVEGALAGLTIGADRLIVAERDLGDTHDVYRCFNANDGELLWRLQFPTRGTLDYGQSPRAVPVINRGRAFLLGAFGELRCVDLVYGKVLWRRELPREFGAAVPTWGMCSPPLVVGDVLIVNPGGTNASLVALDSETGATRWTTPGRRPAYSAFICENFGGRRQIVGYDEHSLGGWDVKTGKRLWQLFPPTEGDFNVPTPIAMNGRLLVATENNGTRLYQFDSSGRILPTPAAQFADLSPDTASPVVTGGRVFGAARGTLFCLDAQDLKPVWHRDENDLGDHATFLADDERVLVISLRGELILLDAKADQCAIISRMKLFEDDVEVYSHPALVGTRLFARGGSSIVCVDLGVN